LNIKEAKVADISGKFRLTAQNKEKYKDSDEITGKIPLF
jgi:hypothetical protein